MGNFLDDVPDDVVGNILTAIAEDKRLRSLSNEELVRDYLLRDVEVDDEPWINEMLSRLWPQWVEVDL